jgi:hypothetical protein
MTLAPAASITLGSKRFDSHALRVVVTLAPLPAVSSFTAFFPPSLDLGAAADDDALLELDGGEGSELVLTGKVRAIRHGIHATEVIAADASADLARMRSSTTYRGQGANDVIKALCSDADVSVGNADVDLDMPAFVAHQRRSAAEHIASLAALTGALARCNADGELDVDRPAGVVADLALLYGREVITCDVCERATPSTQPVITGSGPAGSAKAPNALRPSKEMLPSGAPDPGPDAQWIPAPMLRTPAAVISAGQAAALVAAASAKKMRATSYLVPALRPGIVVEIRDLPDALGSDSWLITRVTHVLDARNGGRTHFEGEAASGLDLGALLGAALSAVGGLL